MRSSALDSYDAILS